MNNSSEINLNRYFINKYAQPNGLHKVHKDGCDLLSDEKTFIDLGIHMHGRSAMVKAKFFYQQANSCKCCANEYPFS